MKRATDKFNNEQRQQVETSVREAEAKTSCEIVPVVAGSSGRYDRPEDVVGLWLATVAAVTVWLTFPRQLNDSGNWGGPSIALGLLTMVVCVVAGFVIGAIAGSKIDVLRRLFTPRAQQRQEVSSRAREVFFDKRVHHTAESTGLLFYVSLFEQMAVILGDQAVVEKLGQGTIDQLCQKLTSELKSTDISTALSSAISEAGTTLADVLPRENGDVNEFADTLILID